jgi:CBS domain-containing protein
LLNATIFFDFRPVSGAGEVVAQLRAWLAGYAQERGPFLLSMARNALANAPALGVVRDFVLAGNGDHAGTLDLKVNGVQLFVEAVRVYGLAAGLSRNPYRRAPRRARRRAQIALRGRRGVDRRIRLRPAPAARTERRPARARRAAAQPPWTRRH